MFNKTVSENEVPARGEEEGGILSYCGVFWKIDTLDNNDSIYMYIYISELKSHGVNICFCSCPL